MFVCPCVLGAGLLMFVSVFVRCTVKSTQVKKIPKHQTLFLFILLALVASWAAGLPNPSK